MTHAAFHGRSPESASVSTSCFPAGASVCFPGPGVGGRGIAGLLAALAVAIAGLVASPALAQDRHEVLVVTTEEMAAYRTALDAFRDAYGKPVATIALPKGDGVAAPHLARIREAAPKAVVAIGSQAATGLHGQLDGTPVVYAMVLDPEKRGLTGPGVTGVRLDVPPQIQLRQFKRVVPDMKRVGVVFNPDRSGPFLLDARRAAAAAGLTLVEVQVEAVGQVPGAVEGLAGRVDALWLIPDPSVVTGDTLRHMLVVTLERKVPLLVFSTAFVKAGALAAVAPDYRGIGRETAELTRTVVSQGTAAGLPARTPPTSLIVNERTASKLGLRLDPSVRGEITFVK